MRISIKKVVVGILLVAIGSLCLTGCDMDDQWENDNKIELETKSQLKIESDMRNVEQRDYATLLLVSNGQEDEDYEFTLGIAKEKKVGEQSQNEEVVSFVVDDLEDLYEKYWSVKGKSLSLVHLKVILMDTPEDYNRMYLWEFLDDLEESKEIAKTCTVIQISDKEAFLKYVKDAKEPVGIYIHNLIKINEENNKHIPQVKDYLKVMREGIKQPIYYLEQEKEGWSLKCREELG